MPYDLRGRRVLVTAASRGLGALAAKRFAQEGCKIALNYFSSHDAAETVVNDIKKAGATVAMLQGDAGDIGVCEKLVEDTVKELGGIDIVVSNACWQVNVKSQHALCRAAVPHFNANPQGGVFLMTSSVAGNTQSGSSMAYSVTKAAGLHLMKCLAATQGPKVRVNAVLPGWLDTDWGAANLPPDAKKVLTEKAVLKRIPSLEDTVDAFVMLAKNESMTGAKVQVGKFH
ncbi:MAG: hypothetical protein Q9162_007744 [Coniocarpon cinnabarinum]